MKLIKYKQIYEKDINNLTGKAAAIVYPESDEEIIKLVKSSNSDLIVRGGGTSFTGALIPNNSIIIDMSKKDKILELNLERKTIYIESGVILQDLNDKLKKYNLEFPIQAFFPKLETIGGMIAKNSCGSREIKYARMMNWVESLEVINGKGELIKVPKSDLSEFIGMEGITGIILWANLRLTSIKKRTLSILKSESLSEIFKANKKLRLSQEIASIDLFDKDLSKLLGFERKYHLFIEYESESGLFKDKDYEKFIAVKQEAYKKIAAEGYVLVENSKIFMDSLEDFTIYLEKNSIPFYANFSSGVFYSFFKENSIANQKELCNFVKKLKGKVSYCFGIGLLKKEYLDAGEQIIIKRVKDRHDPNWKFNRNKLIDINLKIDDLEQEIEKVEQEIDKDENKDVDMIENQQEQSSLITEEKQTQLFKESQPKKELSHEEKEKIKKIAFGFFGGDRKWI